MINERDFDAFVQQASGMVVNRSFGRGRGTAAERRSQNGSVGALANATLVDRVVARGSLYSANAPEGATDDAGGGPPELGPPELETRRTEQAPLSTHERSGQSEPRTVPTSAPAENSSLNEQATPPQVANAIQALLASSDPNSLSQVLSHLLTVRQQPTPSVVTAQIPSYHVIPNLSRDIETFTGDEDGIRAREWIDNLETLRDLHKWPDDYLLAATPMHLGGGARDWFRNRVRSLNSWGTFRDAFSLTFTTQEVTATRWDRMRARTQKKGESLSQYFHAKVRLCGALDLTFDDEKGEVLRGLWSRELARTLLSATHYEHGSLLHDMIRFDRCLGGERETERARQRNSNDNTNAPETRRDKDANKNRGAAPTGPRERVCYRCRKTGHVIRDCPNPANEVTCYKCHKVGHVRKSCPTNTKAPETNQVHSVNVARDPAIKKYLKVATVNGHLVTAFIDTGSAEYVIREACAKREKFEIQSATKALKPWGPPGNTVETVGTVCGDVTIDNIEVRGIMMQVCPDDFQLVDILVGRTFTDADNVNYQKNGDIFVFTKSNDRESESTTNTASVRASGTTVVPPNSICLVSVGDSSQHLVPIVNASSQPRQVIEGTPVLRGQVSQIQMVDRRSVSPSDISETDIIIGEKQSDLVRK